jgi:hypothetical protein
MTDAQAKTSTTKLLAETKITLDKRLENLLLHVVWNTRASVLNLELEDI